jgi:hypothetical protein
MPESRLRFFAQDDLLAVIVASPPQVIILVQKNLEAPFRYTVSDALHKLFRDFGRMDDDAQFRIKINRALVPVKRTDKDLLPIYRT